MNYASFTNLPDSSSPADSVVDRGRLVAFLLMAATEFLARCGCYLFHSRALPSIDAAYSLAPRRSTSFPKWLVMMLIDATPSAASSANRTLVNHQHWRENAAD
jgi:hypothetical protein